MKCYSKMLQNLPSFLEYQYHKSKCFNILSILLWHKTWLGKKWIFFSSWGMKDLMPSTHYPWSDSTYLLISWLYDHLNVKFVKIECNIWKGACWRISLIWLKLFRFLCVFPDSVEKVYWYQHLTSILASTISTIGPELQ